MSTAVGTGKFLTPLQYNEFHKRRINSIVYVQFYKHFVSYDLQGRLTIFQLADISKSVYNELIHKDMINGVTTFTHAAYSLLISFARNSEI